MAIQLVQLPYKIEDVGQGKKKEEEEGRRRNVGWIKVARSGNLRFLRGEGKKNGERHFPQIPRNGRTRYTRRRRRRLRRLRRGFTRA